MNIIFENWAIEQGWNIVKLENSYSEVPEYYSRYNNIPEEWLNFIREYADLSTAREDAWFLTFNSDELGDFKHDEFEIMTLEAIEGDEISAKTVKEFWDRHLAIVMSVGHGYEYYAISLNTGEVVHGCEPEFEETTVIASSFDDFVRKLISGAIVL